MARARRRWRREQGKLKAARLVFLDETAVTTKMVQLRGRSRRGERLVGRVPHGHWKTVSFVAGLRHDRMIAPFVVDGAMNGEVFRAYIEQSLAPTLKRGDIVIMDTCRPTRCWVFVKRSKPSARRFVICRHIRPISTRSRCRSVN